MRLGELEKPLVIPDIQELRAFGQLAGALFPKAGQTDYFSGRRSVLSSKRLVDHALMFCTREMFELLFGRREFGPVDNPINYAMLRRAVEDVTAGGLDHGPGWRQRRARMFRVFEAAAEIGLIKAVKEGRLEPESLHGQPARNP